MKMRILPTLAAFGVSGLLTTSAIAAEVAVDRVIDTNTTWTADNTYMLQGYTFVVTPSGASSPTVLTIEPGTVIKGVQSTGANAAALIITRGAQIDADGTAESPIIFTSELDDLQPGTLTVEDTSLWGGVIILGAAKINSRADGEDFTVPGEDSVEGLEVSGSEVDYAKFGGDDDEDNSGVFRYVSIRHGGAVIGADNEINGLTLGGVGSGTTIDYVETFANKDDDVEFFGGAVNLRHFVAAFSNDDGPDIDQGYRGTIQFVFKIQTDIGTDKGDNGTEWDGATSPLDALPIGDATIANVTYIGIGPSGRANRAFDIRDHAVAHVFNSVFTNYAKGILIESDIGDTMPEFRHNLWWSHIPANNTAEGLTEADSVAGTSDYWTDTANDNQIVDPMLQGISYSPDGGLNPVPAADSPAFTGDVETLPEGFEQVDYKGAFAPGGPNWAAGWTKLSQDGYFADGELTPGPNQKFTNIATRCFVGTGDSAAIPGFVIEGPDPKTVLIRAAGTELTDFGVSGVLEDPVMELKQDSTTLASNDDWELADNASLIESTASTVGAFALTSGSTSAAILITLPPGAYTVVVTGKGGTTGNAIVEVYGVN